MTLSIILKWIVKVFKNSSLVFAEKIACVTSIKTYVVCHAKGLKSMVCFCYPIISACYCLQTSRMSLYIDLIDKMFDFWPLTLIQIGSPFLTLCNSIFFLFSGMNWCWIIFLSKSCPILQYESITANIIPKNTFYMELLILKYLGLERTLLICRPATSTFSGFGSR